MRGLIFSLLIVFFSLVFINPNQVLAQKNTPNIKNIFPKKVAVGDSELRIRVVGKSKYKKDSSLIVNGSPVNTQFQEGTLIGTVPANLIAQPGTITVAVMSKGTMSNTDTVDVVAASDVVITAIRPRIVIANEIATNFGVEIQGNNFTSKSTVRVGGFKTTTQVRRKGELSFAIGTVDPIETTFVGTVPVQIENGDGTLSNTFNITIAPPGPNLTELEPSSADLGAKTTKVKIKGGNFTKDSIVLVNGQSVPVTLQKGKKKTTQLEATFDASLFTKVGQITVKVVTPNVGDSETLLFDVTPSDKTPLIYSIDPSNIVAGTKDVEMIVIGANLENFKEATFNGIKIKKDDVTELSRRTLRIVVRTKQLESPTTLNLQISTNKGTTNTVPLVVEPAGTVSTILGSFPGFTDGSGKDALLTNPSQLAVGPDGMIYIADQTNNAIRKFNPSSGQLVTIAGDPDGIPGYVDTDEINKNNPTVRFSNPIGIVVTPDNSIYVTDFGNEAIRRLRPNSSGTFTVDTIAGKSRMAKNEDGTKERVGEMGFLDDIASRAVFSGPYGIAIDMDGNLLVSDSFNNVIRKVTLENGEATFVSTILGNGFPGLSDGNGNSVQFNRPLGLIMRNNTLFVSDFSNNSIRQVDMSSNQVQVFVGLRRRIQSSALNQVNVNSPTFGDGNRFFAVLKGPISSTFDMAGNLYVLDFDGSRIRRVTPDGVVTTVIGGARGFEDGSAPKVAFRDPRFMLMIEDKVILVVDSGNHRVRRVVLP